MSSATGNAKFARKRLVYAALGALLASLCLGGAWGGRQLWARHHDQEGRHALAVAAGKLSAANAYNERLKGIANKVLHSALMTHPDRLNGVAMTANAATRWVACFYVLSSYYEASPSAACLSSVSLGLCATQ